MTFWKDKQGNELTFKEFMSRWKKGIEGVTALQQLKMQINSMYIMIIGLICGIVITLIAPGRLWWLTIILFGGLFNIVIQYLGVWQKKKMLENIEKEFGGLTLEREENETNNEQQQLPA